MLNRIAISLALLLVCAVSHSETNQNFISQENGKLYDGEKEFRFISWNIPNLHIVEDNFEFFGDSAWRWPDSYEVNDALESTRQMGGKVVRTYVISVMREGSSMGNHVHVLGPGKFNEEAFVALDLVLKVAKEKGIRVIIPLVDNWHWWGGVRQYEGFRDKQKGCFWTDPQVIKDFQTTVNYVINRKNTFTGKRYGDDKTILGWETGNELDSPAEWTKTMSAYIKSLDKNHLVIDGNSLHGIPKHSLEDPNIDVVTTHHYDNANNNTSDHVLKAYQMVNNKKGYFVGEFGFLTFNEARKIIDVVVDNDICGALYWSLRFHRREGGFYWHDEPLGEDIFKAYHWPGFVEGDPYNEQEVTRMLHEAAFKIQGVEACPLPVPKSPNLIETPTPGILSWQGSAGARYYDVQRKSTTTPQAWKTIATDISDARVQYRPQFVDETAFVGVSYEYRVIAKNESGASIPSNTIGPIELKARLFFDELEDRSRLKSYAGRTELRSRNSRQTQEDIHRLECYPNSEIVYEVTDDINELRIWSFSSQGQHPIKVSISSDGREYKTVQCTSRSKKYAGKDYQYLIPTLTTANLPNDMGCFVKIRNPSLSNISFQLSRIDLEY